MVQEFSISVLSLFPLAEMTLGEKLIDATTVAIVGMGTVLFSLWIIGEIFALLNRSFEKRPTSDTHKPSDQRAAIPATGKVDPCLVAVITAAAMAMTGRRVALRRITFLNTNTVSGWAEAGRTSIHLSHNLRRNR